MKRFSRFVLGAAALLTFMLTSCIDYVQTLTYKDGKYRIYCKMTVNKPLLSMAGGDQDLSEFDSMNMPEDMDGTFNPVETDLEKGIELILNVNPSTSRSEEKDVLPTKSGKKVFIPFVLEKAGGLSNVQNIDLESQSGKLTLAMMSSAKCNVQVSKRVVPSVQMAYFASSSGQDLEIPFYDYGDSWCMEIPFVTFMQAEAGLDFSKIVLETD